MPISCFDEMVGSRPRSLGEEGGFASLQVARLAVLLPAVKPPNAPPHPRTAAASRCAQVVQGAVSTEYLLVPFAWWMGAWAFGTVDLLHGDGGTLCHAASKPAKRGGRPATRHHKLTAQLLSRHKGQATRVKVPSYYY